MAIVLRNVKGSPLTHIEMDNNLNELDTRLNSVENDFVLSDLSNVDTTGVINGSVLKYDGTNWVIGTDQVVTGINDIPDVNTSGAVNGSVLKYDGTNWVIGTDNFYTNSDVDSHFNTGTASEDQILSWNGTDYTWIDNSARGFTYNEDDIFGTSEIGVTADVFDFGDGKTIDMQNSSILFTGSTISGLFDQDLNTTDSVTFNGITSTSANSFSGGTTDFNTSSTLSYPSYSSPLSISNTGGDTIAFQMNVVGNNLHFINDNGTLRIKSNATEVFSVSDSGTVTATSFVGDGSSLTGIPAGYTDSDVDTHLNTGTAGSAQVLSWNGTDYTWVNQTSVGTAAINDLSDVNTSGAVNGSVLKYDGSNWVIGTDLDIANPFDQDLNTTDDVTFNSVTTAELLVNGAGTSTIQSGNNIVLDAANRVLVSDTPFRVAPLTTVQRDAIAAPENGDILYNTSDNVFELYQNGSWVTVNTNPPYTDSDVDTHLNTGTASSAQVLSWNGTDYAWVNQTSVGTAAINDLSDVNTSGAVNGSVLKYDGSNWVVGSDNLYTDSDVDTHLNTGSATSGQYLGWNGTDYVWSAVSGYTDDDVNTHLNTSTALSGEILSWNGTDYAWTTNNSYSDTDVENYLSSSGVFFSDNVKARFGNSSDLEIYHDGTDSLIVGGAKAVAGFDAPTFKGYIPVNATTTTQTISDMTLSTVNAGDATGGTLSDGDWILLVTVYNTYLTQSSGAPAVSINSVIPTITEIHSYFSNAFYSSDIAIQKLQVSGTPTSIEVGANSGGTIVAPAQGSNSTYESLLGAILVFSDEPELGAIGDLIDTTADSGSSMLGETLPSKSGAWTFSVLGGYSSESAISYTLPAATNSVNVSNSTSFPSLFKLAFGYNESITTQDISGHSSLTDLARVTFTWTKAGAPSAGTAFTVEGDLEVTGSIIGGYTDDDVDTHLNTGTASSAQVLSWNGTDYAWVNQTSVGTAAINDLSDVNTSGAVNGSVLKYDGSNWVVGSDNTGSAGITISDVADNVNYNVTFTNETSGTQTASYIDDTAFTYNPSTGTVNAFIFNSTSDIKLKDNVETIDSPIEKVMNLRGVNFDWKHSSEKSIGVIAQEVEKIIPEAVADNNDVKSVNYDGLVGLLIEAIKEQQKEINELKKKIQ